MTAPGLLEPAAILASLEQVAEHGVTGEAGAAILDVGTAEYLSYFEREVLDGLLHAGSACRFFEGGYGSGKTHLLGLLADLGLRRGMAVARTDLTDGLRLDDWHSITRFVFQRLEMRVGGTTLQGLPRILDGLRESGQLDGKALTEASLPHVGFHNAITWALANPGMPRALYLYLTGVRVTVRELQRAGVTGVKDPLSKRNAELVLATLAGAFRQAGLPGIMLLFDENERSLGTPSGRGSVKVRVAANLMRRIVDGCATGEIKGLLVAFAVLPGFLEQCFLVYPALGQRLEMVRDPDVPPSWRWPVLPVHEITCCPRESFPQAAAERLASLVARCGGETGGLVPTLEAAGEGVLSVQAGSGYRRLLMKEMAVIALRRLEGGTSWAST